MERLLLYFAAGYRHQTSGVFNATGSIGYAWSAAVTGANGYLQRFHSTDVTPSYGLERAYGFPVRCVQHLLVQLKVENGELAMRYVLYTTT